MAVPYTRVRIQGSLPGGEVWSVNPAFIGNFDTSPATHAQMQAWADAIATILQPGPPEPLAGWLSNRGSIDGVRAESYGPDGRLSDYAEAALSPAYTGSQSVSCPMTTAVVLSLYTGIPGRSYRGRLYWPAPGLELDTADGRIPAANVTGAALAAVDMLSDIQDAAPATWNCVLGVWSKTRQSGTAVTSIRVGNVPDSQRGRKDALVEAYGSAPYPLP